MRDASASPLMLTENRMWASLPAEYLHRSRTAATEAFCVTSRAAPWQLLLCALCFVRCASCSVRCALRVMLCALCVVLCAVNWSFMCCMCTDGDWAMGCRRGVKAAACLIRRGELKEKHTITRSEIHKAISRSPKKAKAMGILEGIWPISQRHMEVCKGM